MALWLSQQLLLHAVHVDAAPAASSASEKDGVAGGTGFAEWRHVDDDEVDGVGRATDVGRAVLPQGEEATSWQEARMSANCTSSNMLVALCWPWRAVWLCDCGTMVSMESSARSAPEETMRSSMSHAVILRMEAEVVELLLLPVPLLSLDPASRAKEWVKEAKDM